MKDLVGPSILAALSLVSMAVSLHLVDGEPERVARWKEVLSSKTIAEAKSPTVIPGPVPGDDGTVAAIERLREELARLDAEIEKARAEYESMQAAEAELQRFLKEDGDNAYKLSQPLRQNASSATAATFVRWEDLMLQRRTAYVELMRACNGSA